MVNSLLMYDVLGVPASDRARERRARIDRAAARRQGRRKPIASPASRRSGTRRSSPMRCSKPAARRRANARRAGARLAGAAAGARREGRLGGAASRCLRPAAGRSNTPTPIIPTWTTPPSSSPPWIALTAARPARPYARAHRRAAREWIEGLQSKNGGWGAFDADNTYHYLNHIPFADHGALLDPPTADVSARCVSMLAQLGDTVETSDCLEARRRLSARRSEEGRQLVRPLGRQLHLRHLVVALRAQRRRPAA